jgi:hypothetical protein
MLTIINCTHPLIEASALFPNPTNLTLQAHVQHISRHRSMLQPSSAAAADLTASPLPYISPRAPKLQSRRMKGTPMDGLWGAAAATLLRLELAAAAAVDRHAKFGPAAASVLAGIAAGMVCKMFDLRCLTASFVCYDHVAVLYCRCARSVQCLVGECMVQCSERCTCTLLYYTD